MTMCLYLGEELLPNTLAVDLAQSRAGVAVSTYKATLEVWLASFLAENTPSTLQSFDRLSQQRLNEVREHLNRLSSCVQTLRRRLDNVAVPSEKVLQRLDFITFERQLRTRGLSRSGDVWLRLQRAVEDGGFKKILEASKQEVQDFGQSVDHVARTVPPCMNSACADIDLGCQRKRGGDIAIELIKFEQAWDDREEFFVIATLLSLEAWYQYAGYDSVLGEVEEASEA